MKALKQCLTLTRDTQLALCPQMHQLSRNPSERKEKGVVGNHWKGLENCRKSRKLLNELQGH
jgi:hypothetical protein